jgi:hypothetical protein
VVASTAQAALNALLKEWLAAWQTDAVKRNRTADDDYYIPGETLALLEQPKQSEVAATSMVVLEPPDMGGRARPDEVEKLRSDLNEDVAAEEEAHDWQQDRRGQTNTTLHTDKVSETQKMILGRTACRLNDWFIASKRCARS